MADALAPSSRVRKQSINCRGQRRDPARDLARSARVGNVLEAYERPILDATRGDRTIFSAAEGIERLWEASGALLEAPPPVRTYPQDSRDPNAIHPPIAPHAWRLPFERGWRDPNPLGA